MLTRSGLGAAVVAVLAAGFGLLWHYDELIVIAVAIGAALAIAVWSARRQPTLVVHRALGTARVPRGTPLAVEYHVENISTRTTPAVTLIEHLDGEITPVALDALPPGAESTIAANLATRRRGIFDVGPLTARRTDPLGLAVGAREVAGRAAVLVHPRVFPLERISGATRDMETEVATRRARHEAHSGFVSLRDYVPGDDPRMVHWPTTARVGHLMVRENVENRTPEITIVLDASRQVATADDFEEMADIAASLAVQSLGHGMDLVLRTTDRNHPGQRTPIADELQTLRLLSITEQVDGHEVLSVPGLFTEGLEQSTITIVTGPRGPSSRIRDSSSMLVVRVGAGATAGEGVAFAAPDAPTFAARWAGIT